MPLLSQLFTVRWDHEISATLYWRLLEPSPQGRSEIRSNYMMTLLPAAGPSGLADSFQYVTLIRTPVIIKKRFKRHISLKQDLIWKGQDLWNGHRHSQWLLDGAPCWKYWVCFPTVQIWPLSIISGCSGKIKWGWIITYLSQIKHIERVIQSRYISHRQWDNT